MRIFGKSKTIFLFRISFYKSKLCIVWNWSIPRNYFNRRKYLLWGYSKWRQIKQSSSGLNIGLSSNFWLLRIANHVKFTEECVVCTEKHALIGKGFKLGYTWAFHYEPESKRQHRVKTNWLSGRVKVPGTAVSKERHADIFWNVKWPITIDFL